MTKLIGAKRKGDLYCIRVGLGNQNLRSKPLYKMGEVIGWLQNRARGSPLSQASTVTLLHWREILGCSQREFSEMHRNGIL